MHGENLQVKLPLWNSQLFYCTIKERILKNLNVILMLRTKELHNLIWLSKLMGWFSLVHLQLPVAPLQRGDGSPFFNNIWQNESQGVVDQPPERAIPSMITWNYGGNNVAVEGSWDNWASR